MQSTTVSGSASQLLIRQSDGTIKLTSSSNTDITTSILHLANNTNTDTDSNNNIDSNPTLTGIPIDTQLLILSYLQPHILLLSLSTVNRSLYSIISIESIWDSILTELHWYRNLPLESSINAKQYYQSRLYNQHRATTIWYSISGYLSYSQRRTLQLGITDIELIQAELQLNSILPESFRASSRIFNGQDSTIPYHSGLIYGCRLLSINEIIELKLSSNSEFTTTNMNEWIPITALAGTNRYVLSITDGSIWLLTGRTLIDKYKQSEDWLEFIQKLFIPNQLLIEH